MLQAKDFIIFSQLQKEKLARIDMQYNTLRENAARQQEDMWLDAILTRILLCASIRNCDYVDFRIRLGVDNEDPVQYEDYYSLVLITDKAIKEVGLTLGIPQGEDFPSVSEQIQILKDAFCSNYVTVDRVFTDKKYKTEKRKLGLGTKFYLRVYLNQTL